MPATTIAVLPFVNRSPDPDNEYFCDGMTEDIINALAKIDGLKVTSRTSSFFFKGKELPLRQIAKELGVEVVLEGSVRLAGEDMRISTQLVQASDDFHFWSESWDRKFENLFAVQDEIALLIADRLREQFGHFEIKEHLVDSQKTNPDIYSLTLKARHLFNQWNPQNIREAIDLWEYVLSVHPDHVESMVGLADAYGFMATTQFMPREEAWMKAADYTHKAFEIDHENASVHYQLANLEFFTSCSFSAAFEHAQKAVNLQSNYPEAHHFMAFLYSLAGKMEHARKHFEDALKINPLSSETQFYIAYWHYRNGETEKALSLLEENLMQNPNNIPAYITRCYCLLMLNRNEEVLSYLASLSDEIIIPDEKQGLECLACIRSGDDKAEAAFLTLEKAAQNPMSFQSHSYFFLALVNKGQFDRAFAWLEQSLNQKSSILLLAFSDPLASSLRTDSRYVEWQKEIYDFPADSENQLESKAAFDDAIADEMTDTLLRYISEEEPFLDPKVSLRSLAAQLGFHPNQLSWLLNARLNNNFNGFINHYRVERFKALAGDPSNAHISLLGLAFESGFNSKTVFNTWFKKETGMTPNAYLKSQK